MSAKVSVTDLPPMQGPRGVVPGRFLLEGAKFGLQHLTLVLGETAPGKGGSLHQHDYEEVFIVHSGRGTYVVGDTVVEAGPGDVVLIPANTPHRFANEGTETLCHTAVHSSGVFASESLVAHLGPV